MPTALASSSGRSRRHSLKMRAIESGSSVMRDPVPHANSSLDKNISTLRILMSSRCAGLSTVESARAVVGDPMDIFVDSLIQVFDDGRDGIVALDGITHHFRSGKLTCLLGPSGCGKTTLAQIIGGIERATRGTIRIVKPQQPNSQSARPGECSVMMWQNLNLFPWRNVIDNVAFGPEMSGVPREKRYERARELIVLVGLKHFENKSCSQLSGGMRQRVALARALVMDRPILLMVKPFAELDAQNQIVI